MDNQTNNVQPKELHDSQPITAAGHEPERLVLDQIPKEKRAMSKLAKTLVISLALLLVAFILLLSRGISFFNFGRAPAASFVNASAADMVLMAGSMEKFNYLSQQNSSSCGLQPDTVLTYADATRLQGSCYSPMDLQSYQAQVESLKRYSDIAQIPSDPYDVPASLAKTLLEYQRTIQLTA